MRATRRLLVLFALGAPLPALAGVVVPVEGRLAAPVAPAVAFLAAPALSLPSLTPMSLAPAPAAIPAPVAVPVAQAPKTAFEGLKTDLALPEPAEGDFSAGRENASRSFEAKLGAASDSGASLPKFVERYWDHPDSGLVAARLGRGENISFDKKPFRLDARVTERNDTLKIVVTSLASPRFVHGAFGLYVAVLNRAAPGFDATLPKAMAGILRGALERHERNPRLKVLRILAPSVMNERLAAMLRASGFKAGTTKVGFADTRQIVLGESSYLELELDFDRLRAPARSADWAIRP